MTKKSEGILGSRQYSSFWELQIIETLVYMWTEQWKIGRNQDQVIECLIWQAKEFRLHFVEPLKVLKKK